jgi:peptidyl-prolyl cis-trans isomerase D
MIRQQLILQQAEDLGLAVGDGTLRQMIANLPAFQNGGRFDNAVYQRALRYQGLTPTQFEEQLRGRLVTAQLSAAVKDSALITEQELEAAVRMTRQQRALAYVVIPASRFESTEALPESRITEYYEAHQKDFLRPERVKIEYVELDVAAVGGTLEADEDSLREYYEQNQASFGRPEQKRVSHILVEVAEDSDPATVAAAREKAESIRDRLSAGEEFSAVAKELSDDPVSAPEGGDLGFLEKGLISEEFDATVADLDVGALSEPVRTPFGFHLIRVSEIRPSTVKPFDEAREDVLERWRKKEGERRFYELADQLSTRAYEEPDSLMPAAEEAGLKIRVSEWFDRQGGEGLLASPKVARAAFSDDVLLQGLNSEAIELGPEHLVILRVKEHEEEMIRPLSDVREQVIETLRAEDATQRASEVGQAWLEALRDGETTLKAVAESEGETLVEPGMVERTAFDVPIEIIETLFTLGRPTDGQPVFASAVLANGDFGVIQLSEVKDGRLEELPEDTRDVIRRQLAQAKGSSYFEHMIQHLRNTASIEISSEP